MKEDAPSLPRIVERLAQLFLVGNEPDTALSVRVRVGVGIHDRRGPR
jgi:hypothetical protein